MGAGASAGIQETVIASSDQELKDAIAALADDDRKKHLDGIKDAPSGGAPAASGTTMIFQLGTNNWQVEGGGFARGSGILHEVVAPSVFATTAMTDITKEQEDIVDAMRGVFPDALESVLREAAIESGGDVELAMEAVMAKQAQPESVPPVPLTRREREDAEEKRAHALRDAAMTQQLARINSEYLARAAGCVQQDAPSSKSEAGESFPEYRPEDYEDAASAVGRQQVPYTDYIEDWGTAAQGDVWPETLAERTSLQRTLMQSPPVCCSTCLLLLPLPWFWRTISRLRKMASWSSEVQA